MLSVKSIGLKDLKILQEFLGSEGKSLDSFRYFNTRPLDIISNHIVTYLIFLKEKPVAYGHLDKEEGIIWLGIIVAEKYTGMGLGKLLMQLLMVDARIKRVKCIRLSVDNDNKRAIALYKKMGFKLLTLKEKIQFLQLEL